MTSSGDPSGGRVSAPKLCLREPNLGKIARFSEMGGLQDARAGVDRVGGATSRNIARCNVIQEGEQAKGVTISATPPLLSQKFSSPAVHTHSRAFLVVADNLAAVLAVGLEDSPSKNTFPTRKCPHTIADTRTQTTRGCSWFWLRRHH